jgi:hypothetical protein
MTARLLPGCSGKIEELRDNNRNHMTHKALVIYCQAPYRISLPSPGLMDSWTLFLMDPLEFFCLDKGFD